MNTLPSPPLRPLAHNSPRSSYQRTHHSDSAMENLLASVWHSIQQSPPPSLRDILDAYRTKGDGDRDMLIAMLNAKSAEDQRIASLASLQRTMLEMYQPSLHSSTHAIPPLQLSAGEPGHSHYAHHHSHGAPSYSSATHMPSPPHTSYHHSPHPRVHTQEEPMHHSHRRSDSAASASSPTSRDSLLAPPESPSRKRRRSSRSPPPSRDRYRSHHESLSGVTRDLPTPPSPYSSASSHSSSGSPRSRESMAINALLSTSQARTEDGARRLSTSSERHSSAPRS